MKTHIIFLLAALLIISVISVGQQIKKEKPTNKPARAAIHTKQDSIISDLVNIAANAYQYRIRPSKLDGGGGSYKGYNLPKKAPKGIKIVKISADQIVFKNSGTIASLDSIGKVTFK
jgi:hypothetical protein